MKQLLIFLFAFIDIVYGQSSPTTIKTRFVNGLYLGTKPNNYFNFADSNAVYWSPDSLLMAKYKGAASAIAFKKDSTELLSEVVRTFGGQNVSGVKNFTDSTKTKGLAITSTADSSIIFTYPAQLKTMYRFNSYYPANFGFNIVPVESNSFFTYSEEGLAHQAYYKGDGDGNTNIWGVSSKLNTDTGWIPRMVVNQNGRVGINTNTPLVDLDVRGDAKVKTLISDKHFNGGADTLFSDDPYTSNINTTKTGFVHHYYGVSQGQTNGGGDITFFKESGLAGYKKTSVIADKRVVGGQEIWYHQYSAHNGVDSIYSTRSIAAVAKAQASFNSSLGDMKGWYQITTARDSGFKETPSTIDFVASEGRVAFNAPSNLRNSDLIRSATVYGSLRASDTILTSVLNVGSNFNAYINGSILAFRKAGSSFDALQIQETNRPLVFQGSASHIPGYLYTDASGIALTRSATQITGYSIGATNASFSIDNNEIMRYDNAAGPRLGVGTAGNLNASLHVKGSTSSTRAFLVTNNLNAELFRVNNSGAVIASNTVQAPKLVGNSAAPTVLMAGNFTTGIGATATVMGNDMAGEITFTTTTGISTSGTIFTFTFSSVYPSDPIVVFSPVSESLVTGANPIITRLYVSSIGTLQFQVSIAAGTLLSESTTYKLNYHVLGK